MASVEMPETRRTPKPRRGSSSASRVARGLRVDSVFCPAEVADPFDTVTWELRTAAIKGEVGNVLFEQHGCEVPSTWSQLATNVVVSKYFYGEVNTPERETSVRQVIHRVSRTIADWGIQQGYFASDADGERFYRDLTWLCLHQHGAFNSPVWFNVGLFHQYGVTGAQCNWHWNQETETVEQPENPYQYPQGSACFIQSVDDHMESIMELARSEAMLFKFGSGTGTDLSTIRSHREMLAGGGKTRRAAKMQSIKIWHPDVLEFIECKAKEEAKARILIEKGGYDSNFNGEAYSSIMFQNANLSVRVTDDFLDAVEKDAQWSTHWVTDPAQAGPSYKARDMIAKMAENAWQCGDPGVQYDSTINEWHTCPNSGRINASNPCSEYMFLDETACNLASINLMKFRLADGSFDVERFEAACRTFFIAQEILVDNASYPTKKIAANSHAFRPLGLGYSNLGSLMMSTGLPYDSAAAHGLCGAITAILHGAANLTSSELAAAVGPFAGYAANRDPMLRVMEMHREKVDEIDPACPEYLVEAARRIWDDVLAQGRQFGFRNAQATVLAPTGTISFMMDCDTTGIEPDIALVKYKQLAGGGMLKIVNQTVPLALSTMGYDEPQIKSILDYIEKNDTIEGAPDLKTEHLPVFDCAFPPANGVRSIQWQAHVQAMAAAQPFLSGAISKTVNMPRDTTPADIASAYLMGGRLGLKALAIYRDGSKESQPLNTKSETDKASAKVTAAPRRERLPDTRRSVTHKFSLAGHEGYLTVGLYEDGRPGELFITMAKEGSTIGGLMDCFGTAISMSLQYGVPLEVLVNKFSHTRFEPMGHTKNPDIRIAKSIVDYIFRWMGITFIQGYREANIGLIEKSNVPEESGSEGASSDRAGGATKAAAPKLAQGPSREGAIAGPWETSKAETSKAGGISGSSASNGANGSATNGHSTNGNGSTGSNGTGATAGLSSSAGGAPTSAKLGGSTAGKPKSEASLLERAGALMTRGEGNLGNRADQFARFQTDAPSCDNCGSITVRNGNCYLCHNCGNSMGCS
jgi:ribonucleoside-diphosphate reductase alpha chain